jgi:hypothetical protein
MCRKTILRLLLGGGTGPWRELRPFCLEKDYDLRIPRSKLGDVTKEYDIRSDSENIVPTDDTLADNVWQAALDLYLS